MPQVSKSVLVPYSAENMFDLVDAVERYPEFMPWCADASVAQREEGITRATLHISFRGVRQSFTTENFKERPHEMHVKLVEGPFRSLDGTWRFVPLAADACRIEFDLRYEFSNRILEKLIGAVFQYIASTLVDAFIRRAKDIHGAGRA